MKFFGSFMLKNFSSYLNAFSIISMNVNKTKLSKRPAAKGFTIVHCRL